jgi:hypothetical protein
MSDRREQVWSPEQADTVVRDARLALLSSEAILAGLRDPLRTTEESVLPAYVEQLSGAELHILQKD